MTDINRAIVVLAGMVNKPVASYSVRFDEISITFGGDCEFGFSGIQQSYVFGSYEDIRSYVNNKWEDIHG